MPAKRQYNQVTRAAQREALSEELVAQAGKLMLSAARLDDVTLEAVAASAQTTVRTILRHFGTRDMLIEAALVHLHQAISVDRKIDCMADHNAAIESLLTNYEAIGDMAIRGLREEDRYALLRDAFSRARTSHMAWLAAVFADWLALAKPDQREQRLIELYAVTDLYQWKLLRRDMGLGAAQTLSVIQNLVAAVLGQHPIEASTARETAG